MATDGKSQARGVLKIIQYTVRCAETSNDAHRYSLTPNWRYSAISTPYIHARSHCTNYSLPFLPRNISRARVPRGIYDLRAAIVACLTELRLVQKVVCFSSLLGLTSTHFAVFVCAGKLHKMAKMTPPLYYIGRSAPI